MEKTLEEQREERVDACLEKLELLIGDAGCFLDIPTLCSRLLQQHAEAEKQARIDGA